MHRQTRRLSSHRTKRTLMSTTVTTNKKAAKAYDASGVYSAKESAEKQGFALRAETADADD